MSKSIEEKISALEEEISGYVAENKKYTSERDAEGTLPERIKELEVKIDKKEMLINTSREVLKGLMDQAKQGKNFIRSTFI